MTDEPRYYLGCPMWANKSWVGELYQPGTRQPDFLAEYASVFSAVEGNTTFYALPTPESVARWREQTPEHFRLVCKLPRSVSHDGGLSLQHPESVVFFERATELGSRGQVVFVQLGPHFGPEQLPQLEAFLRHAPTQFHYVVEVRHTGFFDRGPREEGLDQALSHAGADKVIMDTRVLMGADSQDPFMAEKQRRKPRMPVRRVALGPHPVIRLVQANDLATSEPLLAAWADVVAEWIAEGRRPMVFLHSANDFYAPRMARRFHQLLSNRVDLPPMPTWPAERPTPGQLPLLG